MSAAFQIDHEDFRRIGVETFGEDPREWVFKCVACGHEQSVADVTSRLDLDDDDAFAWIASSCEGRHNPDVGCDWTLGGLFRMHSIEVRQGGRLVPTFEFADVDAMAAVAEASAEFVPFEHPTTDVEGWEEFDWSDHDLGWVPVKVRTAIEDFWSERIGRSPSTWMADAVQQGSPGIGAEVDGLRVSGGEGRTAAGRYVHCWNNIGRVVLEDGSFEYVHF